MLSFCVSLTTIPPRYSTLQKTLDSIQGQKKIPDKIFLNIPNNYKRFSNINFDLKDLLKKYENLKINSCEDFGPGTKLLGSLNEILNYDFVILIDDDHIYKDEMLEIFYKQAVKSLENSYSFCVYDVLDCKVGQGADGFLINTDYIRDILNFFNKYVRNNQNLFFNDDLWISIYLNKILKIRIESLFPLLKKSFFRKNKSVYKKHTQLGALIETYSLDRKKAREDKFKENCKEYLQLKNKTKNFINV
tara:strand:+ start:653 stop:1393 length:741 start_codon:yes stop_codon:yes gene_type:complete